MLVNVPEPDNTVFLLLLCFGCYYYIPQCFLNFKKLLILHLTSHCVCIVCKDMWKYTTVSSGFKVLREWLAVCVWTSLFFQRFDVNDFVFSHFFHFFTYLTSIDLNCIIIIYGFYLLHTFFFPFFKKTNPTWLL